MSSSGKTALVTGANRGIGLEVCRQLAEAGYRVYLGSRDLKAGFVAAADMQELKGRVHATRLDVTDPDSIDTVFHAIQDEADGLDVLVNNAGVALDGFNPDVVRQTLNINYYGVARVTEALLPLMNPHGRVVMVSSGAGGLGYYSQEIQDRFANPALSRQDLDRLVEEFHDAVVQENYSAQGWPGAAYKVSKAGLNGLTRIYAREWENDDRNLKINAVCPGWVRTAMGGMAATKSVSEGAEGVVWAALLDAEGASGRIFRDGNEVEW
jgi:carbonyl reductase 1